MAESPYIDGPIPAELLPGLSREFTEAEDAEIRSVVHLDTAARGAARPRCLWLLGPSCSGKSTAAAAKAREVFGSELNAVIIDGALLRDCHGGWKAVVEDGMRRKPGPFIHRGAWDVLKNSYCIDRKKEQIVEEAVSNRMNLVIPEVGTKADRLSAWMDQIAAAGYDQSLMVLWAPPSVVLARGALRQRAEGKTFSMRGYLTSAKNTLAVAQTFAERRGGPCCAVSTAADRTEPLSLGELEALVAAVQSDPAARPPQPAAAPPPRRAALPEPAAVARIQALARGLGERQRLQKRHALRRC